MERACSGGWKEAGSSGCPRREEGGGRSEGRGKVGQVRLSSKVSRIEGGKVLEKVGLGGRGEMAGDSDRQTYINVRYTCRIYMSDVNVRYACQMQISDVNDFYRMTGGDRSKCNCIGI